MVSQKRGGGQYLKLKTQTPWNTIILKLKQNKKSLKVTNMLASVETNHLFLTCGQKQIQLTNLSTTFLLEGRTTGSSMRIDMMGQRNSSGASDSRSSSSACRLEALATCTVHNLVTIPLVIRYQLYVCVLVWENRFFAVCFEYQKKNISFLKMQPFYRSADSD